MILSPALQTLYADLLQQVHDRVERPGTVYTQRKAGAAFLYVRRTVGSTRIDCYIGPADDPAAAQRADDIRREQVRARDRRKIISALKRAGVPAPPVILGRVLDALSDAGLFKMGVLVGTGAYQCYSPLIGVSLPSASLMTQDADLATGKLTIAADDGKTPMIDILRRADPSFQALPGLAKGALPSAFRSARGFRVDLLTPVLRRSDRDPMPLTRLAAGASPLPYLHWLIAQPVRAVALFGSGVDILVPDPARFAVHKLIVAQRRRSGERIKRLKDLAQATALIGALRDTDPQALNAALRSARAQGQSGWADPIARSLQEIGGT